MTIPILFSNKSKRGAVAVFAYALLLTLTALGAEPLTLFSDSFDRADGDDIDASLDGIVNNTGSGVGGVLWNEFHGAGRTHVSGNQLWLAHGFGTSNACIAHNFINSSIRHAGEFSVSVDITGLTQTTAGYGGGFGIGMSKADAVAATDAQTGDPDGKKFQDAFTGSGNTAGDLAISSFWLVLRGDGTLVWGTYGNAVTGTDESGLAGKVSVGSNTGTISATFSNITDFNAGTTVDYEVFFNGVSKGSGTFQWHGTNANYIGLDGCDPGYVTMDNLAITSVPAGPWWRFEFPEDAPAKLTWWSEVGRNYDLWVSADLSGWAHVDGYPQKGTGGEMEHPFTLDTRGFFKITSEVPPAYEVVFIGDSGMRSNPADINANGLVLVAVETPDGASRLTVLVPEKDNGSLVWHKDDDQDGRNDLLRDLGVPPDVRRDLPGNTWPRKINDDGVILILGKRFDTGSQADSAWILAPRLSDGRLTWSDLDGEGVNRQIMPLPIGVTEEPPAEIQPGDINNHGVVALHIGSRGYLLVPERYEVSAEGAVTVEYPVAVSDGNVLNDRLIDLGPVMPVAINDQGDVAGTVEGPGVFNRLPLVIRPRPDGNGGLVWNEDKDGDGVNDLAIFLPLPAGNKRGDINDMNELGTIVGTVGDGSEAGTRAAIWQVDWETGTATVTTFGTVVADYDTSTAVGVNAANQVVGKSLKFNWPEYPVASNKVWLYDQGEMATVDGLVPSGTGFVEGESRPYGINDNGLIYGIWWPEKHFVYDTFVMIPAAGR